MLSKDQFDREKRYWALLCIAKTMRARGLITNDEYLTIETAIRLKWPPIFGSLPA